MRLVTYESDGRAAIGAWVDGDELIVDLSDAAQLADIGDRSAFGSMLSLIEAGRGALELAAGLVEDPPDAALRRTADCRIYSPLPRPPLLRDFLCFEGHLVNAFKGMARLDARRSDSPEQALREIENRTEWVIPQTWYDRPIYYTASPLAISGHEEDIVIPHYSQFFDFELEFAAIIGSKGKDISSEQAKDYIFGYTIYNDWSARDEQSLFMSGMLGPGKGKDFDQGVTLGPCIVTTDEIGDPYSLEMKARINGEQLSSGNSGLMHYKFEDCIAIASRATTIFPGEVFGSGTVEMGCGLEHDRFLSDGDVVELEIERIGRLRNRVVAG